MISKTWKKNLKNVTSTGNFYCTEVKIIKIEILPLPLIVVTDTDNLQE